MLPKVNQILHLQVASLDEEEAKKEFKSRIAEIHDRYISMEVPLDERTGRLKRLQAGDEISVYFVSDGGVKNYFNSQVLGFKEDVIRLVTIRKPDEESITKVQRRGFLRVPAIQEIAAKLSEQIQFLAISEDVGGGGVSFFCEGHIPIKEHDQLSCWILLVYKNGAIDHAHFMGELVRIKKLESGKQLCMLRYTDIIGSEQQKIMRFCFERQLEFRKR